MLNLFRTVLVMSLVGSVAFLTIEFLKRMLKGILSSRHICVAYYIILMIFLYPFSINYTSSSVLGHTLNNINNGQSVATYERDMNETSYIISGENEKNHENFMITPTAKIKSDLLMKYISIMWILISTALISKKIILYMIFLRKLIKGSEYIEKYMGISVYSSSYLTTPIAIGLFNQKIFLPQTIDSDLETEYILTHEYKHIRRGDILCKWITMLVVSIHWFNPLIYLLSREFDKTCEYACDEAVANKMTEYQKKEYMNTILSMISKSNCKVLPLSTKMTDEKKNIRKRFEIISSSCSCGTLKKVSSILILTAILFFVFTACASFGGKLYGNKVPSVEINIGREKNKTLEKSDHNQLKREDAMEKDETQINHTVSSDEYTKEEDNETENIKENPSYDKTINSHNESHNSNDTEEKTEERSKSLISRSDARVTFDEDSLYPGDLRGEMYLDNWSFEKMINDLKSGEYTQGDDSGTNLEKNYVTGTLTYETGNEAKVSNVKSDSKGHIEFYMDTGYEQFVEIGFEHEGKKIGGAGIIPGNEKLYYFGGFDPDKTYDITIKSSSGDTWKTTSKYVVY